ncbi:MAG: hypothetical protein U1F54_05640 [Burkholderiales bacterium]
MGTANIWIEKYLEGQRITTGAIVDVRLIDAQGGGKRVARTTIPIGQLKDGRQIKLDPGRYEFAALLPSGDVLTQIADIGAGSDPVNIVFDMGHSGHEWMSWQHALGNIGDGNLFHQTKLQLSQDSPWLFNVSAFWFSRPASKDDILRTVATHLANNVGKAPVPFALAGPAQSIPGNTDAPFTSFRLPPAGNVSYTNADFVRHYAVCSDAAGRQMLCVLPYPWRTTRDEEGMVEMLVGPDPTANPDPGAAHKASSWAVSTIARDDHVAPVLSYFASGDDAAAAFLARDALDLLFGKMINPVAASAGAYVLVDRWLRQRDASANWLSWIDNLAKWFPWLPDGELLRGWVALAGGRKSDTLDDARTAFIEAERRGIPIYTAGVKRLCDGLTRVANQDRADNNEDARVTEALDRVRRILWNVDPRYPFTTIRLWNDVN